MYSTISHKLLLKTLFTDNCANQSNFTGGDFLYWCLYCLFKRLATNLNYNMPFNWMRHVRTPPWCDVLPMCVKTGYFLNTIKLHFNLFSSLQWYCGVTTGALLDGKRKGATRSTCSVVCGCEEESELLGLQCLVVPFVMSLRQPSSRCSCSSMSTKCTALASCDNS